MKAFTAIVDKCSDTGLYVGFVPGFPGAHTQAESLDELNKNLKEVIEMLLEDGEPELEAQFVGTQAVMVARSCDQLLCEMRERPELNPDTWLPKPAQPNPQNLYSTLAIVMFHRP